MLRTYGPEDEISVSQAGVTLDVETRAQVTFLEGSNYPDGMLHQEDLAFDRFISTISVSFEDSPITLVLEPDIARVGFADSNWAREFRLDYKINDFWTVKVGRTANSNIKITPPPWMLETLIYPRVPVDAYGYMFKVEYDSGPWQAIVDVGGSGSVPFNHSQAFSRLDMTGRLRWKPSEDWHVAINGQATGDFSRFIVDASWRLGEEVFLKGAAYYADESDDNYWGAYSYLSYRLLDDFELHGMVDFRSSEAFGDDLFVLLGFRWFVSPDDKTDLTFGWIWSNDNETPDRAGFRLRRIF